MFPPNPLADPAGTALLLDFDGTLVEIAPRPDAVTVPHGLPATLDRLHDALGGAVALVSGRAVADLRHYLPDFPGAIIGSHGAELALPGQPLESVSTQGLDAIRDAVTAFARENPTLLLEDKTLSVVLHYRQAPELAPAVERFMGELAKGHPDFALQAAKMAWELRPAGADKGSAVAGLMRKPPFAGRVPLYAGDDTTDEAAMRVAAEFGGAGVKVGDGDSVAAYRLADPSAVALWLEGRG